MTIKTFLLGSIILLFSGCSSSNTPSAPQVKITQQFQLQNAILDFTSKIKTTTIQYHSPSEMKKLFNQKILNKLKNNDLLAMSKAMNYLVINANYKRIFVGEETPLPTESLGYPKYSYVIKVLDSNKKVIRTFMRDHLQYNGGLAMNLQTIAGQLRDKKYELLFIDALVNTIVDDIKKLN